MQRNVFNKPVLMLLFGYPGTGKSFFARQLASEVGAINVNSEQLRQEFFTNPTYNRQENEVVDHLMLYMAEQFLSVGVSVIFDVNAAKLKTRSLLREMAFRNKAKTVLIWVQLDIESAFMRVAKRDRRKIDDKLAIPLDRSTFESLISQMQNPERSEDYVVISGKHTFSTQKDTVLRKLRDIGLINVESNSIKFAKPELVNRIPNPLAGRVDPSRRNISIK